MEEGRALGEALATVKLQLGTMRKCLDSDQLMDGLKAASTMLAELRTSSLSPKQYYELYMAVFDALRYLSTFLYDSHQSGAHHLADLYELVQYAGNIVPRLYLMITVGTVYMSVPDAPIKEIMKDMMEMARGVQHPTRGLFLRHYLSGMTRDHLPIGDDQGPGGNLYDSIGFVLTNFIEMNKLWVRLQHQGLSREREKREMERRELRILVGTNLVRLSQLEGVDLNMYRRIILPAILEQVVNCKDVIAQEYLMEVVIQVFTDEFHLRTLGPFLMATAQLHPKVNIKQIVIALIDRLAAFAAREAENDSKESALGIEGQPIAAARAMEKSESANGQHNPERAEGYASPEGSTDGHGHGGDDRMAASTASMAGRGEGPKYRGIPSDVRLFEVFWHQVVELIKARPDLTIQDITALLVSLINLSLSCYPDRIDYVDQVLAFAKGKMDEHAQSADLHHPITVQNLLALLVAPINAYPSVLTLLHLPAFTAILYSQPYNSRRSIGHTIVSNILKKETIMSAPEDVKGILDLCHVLVKDQRDASIGGGGPGMSQRSNMMPHALGVNGSGQQFGGSRGMMRGSSGRGYDLEEMAEEQGWIARMVHLFQSDDDDVQFKLLQTARGQFAEGGDRIRWTFPPLIVAAIKLARRRHAHTRSPASESSGVGVEGEAKASTLFRFIHQVISTLYTSPLDASDICLRLYLLALQAADESDLEELAYEFAVQAFTIYEESISESKAQLQAITLIIQTLQQTRVFTADNYDTLITKAALHGAKLLKKGHQAMAVMLASHLWWQTEAAGGGARQGKPLCRDGKRVLECLQKALRIATSCIDELTTMQLYVDALDRYIYFFERQVEAITPKHLNSLVELITQNIDNVHASDAHPTSANATAGLVEGITDPDSVVQHFRSTLAYLYSRKEAVLGSGTASPLASGFEEVELVGSLLKMGLQ